MIGSFTPLPRNLVDVTLPPSGYDAATSAGDTTDALRDACGEAARKFPRSWEVDPSEWDEIARENDRHRAWGMNYLDRFTNQSPTHECTTHSLIRNAEAARNRHRGVTYHAGPQAGQSRYDTSGPAGSVWLSPLSVYAEANPGQWGGANVRQVLEIACRRGILPDRTQPRDYGFRHTITGTSGRGNANQSGGRWVPLSQFPDGWQETAKLFRPIEVIFPESYEEAVCCVLRGLLVSVGRNGHAVPWAQWMAGERAMAYPDSYDVVRYDSERTARSAWRGSFAIVTMTTPDDWDHPAL